jgi:amino acid adenylation domain-containing protein
LPVQYADYAVWQRSWLQGEVLEAELAYWRERLSGAPPLLELPLDHPRPAVQSARGAGVGFALAPEVSRALQGLARRQGATVFMVLLAGFQALLARTSGQEDVSVGTPIAGRTRSEIEGLIGFFVNTLVLRTDLSGEPGLGDLVARVRERSLEAYLHQDLPFEKLVEELAPERSLSHAPLFQVMLAFENTPQESLEVPGLTARPFLEGAGMEKFDLTLRVGEGPGGLAGALSYSTDLFDGTTANRLLGRFATLLERIASQPDASLGDLLLPAEAESHQVLLEWNDTAAGPRPPLDLGRLFTQQAGRTPGALAVVSREGRWTYRDLDERASRLARALRGLGVGPEVPVGICAERSYDMVVAVVGVLKAGGFYLPLDPAYPKERLAFMLEDCGAGVLLTQQNLLGGLPESRARVVCLDVEEDWQEGAAPAVEMEPVERLAYAIYTSGSTGRPKGVMVRQSSVVNLAWSLRERVYAGAGEGLRVSVNAPLTFDASVKQWIQLLWGHALVVVPDEVRADGAALLSFLVEQGVQVLDCTPSQLHLLLEAGLEQAATPLEQVLVGGEAISPQLWSRLAAIPGIRFFNVYGPTECTVDATAWEVEAGQPVLGRAIPNARTYVLDRSLRPVPLAAAGELCLGGAGLARGYLSRPDLTAERFVPDPFGGSGERLYRTGDLARHGVDGQLEYLGRVDHQVKMRGFRIELGEIETVLAAQPGVREAAVLARQEEEEGDVRLVAYMALEEGAYPMAADLRSVLREALPDFMVPSAFMAVGALPLTPNGKIDRRALAALAPGANGLEAAREAPRTPIEEVVAGVWGDVLGVERIGARDDFFELGGHSLLATRVISRLRDAFAVELPLRDLFEEPTVAGLARRIEASLGIGRRALAPALVPLPRPDRLPLSFAQQRLWFLDQLQPNSPAYNIPISQHLSGPFDPSALAAAFNEIVRRHEVLRTVYAAVQSEPAQVVLAAQPFALPVLDLCGLPETVRRAEAQRLAGREAQQPFDLAHDPMLRASLVRLAAEEHVVLATMHHIAGDGWSMGILVREVQALYESCRQGQPSPLPPLPVQYADYAVWQRGWLQGEVLERELAYWHGRLAGAPPLLELPTDRPRPAVQSARGASVGFALAPEVARSLQGLARGQGATMFMVLLAGFQALLARISGVEEVSVGTPIAGRTRSEVEDLIGFFVNTLVVRTDLSGDPGFAELVAQVRERSLEAYLHQDLPFEKLVEELAPERSLSHSPLFQVMLAFQNTPQESLEVPGLTARPFGDGAGVEKFDVTLTLAEGPLGVAGALSYNSDLFDGTTIQRLLQQYERLLAGAVADPSYRIAELPLLSDAERQAVLHDWSTTASAAAQAVCLHTLFEAQAARTPDAVAVVFQGQRRSYGELDRGSESLAQRLRELGVGADIRVGVCLERSTELVVSLLGVLRAGGAYVPLDPDLPAERLRYMLADSGASVLLTESRFLDRWPEGTVTTLCLDQASLPGKQRSRKPPAVDPENLAYVMYTSGSTGRPKGVMVSHRGVVNYLQWCIPAYAAGLGQGAPVHTSSGFDLTVTSLWAPLLAGRSVFLLSESSPAAALTAAEQGGFDLSLVKITPSHLEVLADQLPDPSLVARGGVWVIGGEALRYESLALWRALAPSARWVNEYGPTETVVGCCIHEVMPDDPLAGPVPIGRPIAGTQVYVVDARGSLAPVGAPGELLLGGAGLARGYLGKPELTAERFVPNPWPETTGERLYRTGDLVRYRPDGVLKYLGRIDHQVKVRGFRIELGEIETVLASQPGVREAVVLARRESAGDVRLVAYLVLEEGARPAVADLRAALREALPDYMVPSAFSVVDALPLTPNGKVDREALATRAPGRSELEAAIEVARTPIEEVVIGIWSDVLGLERIGASDNFFELGGHSLLATRVISRLRDAFAVELPLRDLFEAPTVAGLAVRIEASLGKGQRALAPALIAVERPDRLPLSFAQERLWFLDQLQPNSPAYNIPISQHLAGPFEAGALAAAFTEIVRRHEVLRTVYAVTPSGPTQVVLASQPFHLPLLDLSRLPEEARQAEAHRLAGREAQQPFDLAHAPMLRASLVRLAPEEHVVLATMHHIASDGWSMGVLVREIQSLYEALCQGRPSPLPPLPVQYADYAVWQRGWLQGEVLEAELAYWRGRLAGAPALLELPLDRPRPAVQSARGASVGFALAPEVARALQGLARRQGATMFMVLLAGFQALLARTSGQEDVSVGTPIAGRTRSEVEDLIGFFVNTLVLRADLTGEPGLGALVARVRERSLEAYLHQDLPFEKLVEELAPERSLSHSPLFQVMFAFQNTPQESLEVPGLTARPFGDGAGVEKFDLTLTLAEDPGGVGGALSYDTDLFDSATADRMLGHFQRLLQELAEHPDQPFERLPLLTPVERHHLLAEWNDTAVARRAPCVHHLIESQAARTPAAVAVTFEGAELSYRELDERANHLAGFLRDLGVGPDVRVGLCVDRSLEMVVGLLAVLKAGGVYVPLDPSYPQERLAYMLRDSRVRVLLTQTGRLEALAAEGAEVVCLDAGGPHAGRRADPPAVEVTGDDLAYVIYTSGSTGRPKGAMVRHEGLSNHMLWIQDRFPLSATDRVLQKTPFSFDASVWEFFAPLIAGARLVMARPEGHRDPAYLVRTLAAEEITILQVVPSLLSLLLAEEGFDRCLTLRRVFCGGEALTPDLAGRLAARLRVELVNVYGPSEATIQMVSWTCPPGVTPVLTPLGRPIDNTRAYVLDRHLEPAPLGVPGELVLGGACLGRGYLGRPDLTAERFLPDPFGSAGERLYRTGDLARRRTDGQLEYLGRLDHQLKVRGFRIELGEVETVLARQPGLREAVVLARQSAPGDVRLVAYAVPDAGARPTAADLRSALRETLPDYMVPAAFILLEALPLTPSGKVDRRALSQLEAGRSAENATFQPPASPSEQIIASLYGELLDVEPVGRDDDFFVLGGHSLLATRLASRLRTAFAVELPLRRIFEAPTVAALALQIDQARRSTDRLPVPPPIQRMPRDRSLPLSFAQQRLWFLDQLEPASPLYNLPLALRIEGELATAALTAAFEAIVQRHEALRTVFALGASGEPFQVVRPPEPFLLPLVDLSSLPAGVREALARGLAVDEAQQPFDLARGPLLRTCLLCLGAQEHAVLLTQHHAVSDGWSLDIMVREVIALYEAFSLGWPSPLPELPIQYSDFAIWQREWLQGETLEAELAYWRRQLAGAPQRLELPTDRPRPAVQSFRGASRFLTVDAGLAQELRHLSRSGGATLFMTLLAAFQLLLARHAGQDDVVVGSPIANRTHGETEGLIGFFVNTLVLRARIDPEISFLELLAQVREATLSAYAHQELPFEKLVEELQPERALAHSPLFQVMFVLQNAAPPVAAPAGLTLAPFAEAGTGAKFDLTLGLREGREEMAVSLEYNRDLFDATSAERLLAAFGRLLQGAMATPAELVFALDLLGEVQRHQIFAEWSDTAAALPTPQAVHSLVEAQAKRRPDALAVVGEESRLTYGELDQQSTRIAQGLRALGVEPEVRVAVAMEHSPERIVALLAVLKAGGAFVPLDPGDPEPRLQHMIQDCSAPLVLVDDGWRAAAPVAARVLSLTEVAAAAGDGGPLPQLGEEALAYVIYTSGSTGRPKGVAVPHRGLRRLIDWHSKAFALTEADRTTQLAGVAFDASQWEAWPSLAVGATLLIPPRAVRYDPGLLVQWLMSEGVTVSFLPTALGEMALEEPWPQECALRLLLLGGDRLMRRPRPGLPFRVINNYGPTECSVVSTAGPIESGEAERTVPPIGRPILHSRSVLLDRTGGPVPIGVGGELAIGGAMLARGYLGQSERTAASFVPDPWAEEPGARLYRTGDLARFRADGSLDFLGRIDQQVKLRGFRIELGEIEAALLDHPGVLQAAVLRRDDVPGGAQLVAYVVATPVAAEGSVPSGAELAAHLHRWLPEYMVPAAFMALEALPLTANGKVDRGRLPRPEITRTQAAPRDLIELQLARIWEEILHVEPIGPNDNFFALGGHSLLAVRLMSRIQAELGHQLPIATLFESPTLESLATKLRHSGPSLRRSALVHLHGEEAGVPLFLIHPVGGNILCYWQLAHTLGSGTPIYGFQLPEVESRETLGSIESIAAHYLQALNTVQPSGPYRLGGWSLGGVIAFEMARQLERAGQQVSLLALIDSAAPGQLPSGPLEGRALVRRFAEDFAGLFGLDDLDLPNDEAEALHEVYELCQTYGLLPQDFEEEETARLFAMFKTGLTALASYRAEPYAGDLLLFTSEESRGFGEDATLGWKDLALGGVATRELAGNHYEVIAQPVVQDLAAELRARLAAMEES